MSDFCRGCSLYYFDDDLKELAGITTEEDEAKGLAACVICEGCGFIQVNRAGECISDDCMFDHKAGLPRSSDHGRTPDKNKRGTE